MRNVAIVFCFLPWFVMAAGLLLTPTVYVPVNQSSAIFSLIWVLLSPAVMAAGLVFAYHQGQRSKKK